MAKQLRVLSDPTLVRDVRTSAILNTDTKGLQQYKLRRAARVSERQEQQALRAEVDAMRDTLSEILAILKPHK